MFLQPRKDRMGQSFLITTVTSAWEAPTWTRRVGGLKSWCPVQTVDALVSVAPSCTCAHRPAAVPPALLCHLPWGGGWSGGVGGGDDFKHRGVFRSLDIFLLWTSRNHALGAREKGKEKFWSCVWPFHEVDISWCVLWDRVEMQHFLVAGAVHVTQSCVCSVEVPGRTGWYGNMNLGAATTFRVVRVRDPCAPQ